MVLHTTLGYHGTVPWYSSTIVKSTVPIRVPVSVSQSVVRTSWVLNFDVRYVLEIKLGVTLYAVKHILAIYTGATSVVQF